MQLGGLTLESPFVAAPMAGISSPAFRLMARRCGAGLVFTEMISAAGLGLNNAKTLNLAQFIPGERPLGVQIFGGDPDMMRRAAGMVSDMPVDVVDVNLGCPARKVRRQGAGSALLDDPGRAAEVVAAVKEGARLPVTVKLRLGFNRDDLERVLPGVLKAGVAAVTLHARTVKQGFSGRADWEAVARLKSWCPVPVIGNGDVRDEDDAIRMLAETGADGVMIGRAAMGDPWIFRRAMDLLAGRAPRKVGVGERRAALREHMELARRYGGEGHAVHFVRKFMMWYSKSLPGAASFRRAAGPVKDLDQLWRLCAEFFDELKEVA